MFRHSHFIFPSAALLFVFIASLARPMAVYADDGTPPPPAAEEPIELPTESIPVILEGESPAAEEVIEPPTESIPGIVEGEPSASDLATLPAAAEEVITVAEVLEAVPEETQVVVMDENGSALPLASQDASEIVTRVDPMWCPAGTLPGGPGCTTSFASPQELIDDMDASDPNSTNSLYEQDGIIYFTEDPGGDFVLTRGTGDGLQGVDYDVLRTFNLTLQGGWNGLNDGAGFALSGQTTFDGSQVQIGTNANPWGGNITINNISIDGAGNAGLLVFTNGDIQVNNVHSQNNDAEGARLINRSGDGTVTVQNSTFNNNGDSGLVVISTGMLTLDNVLANGNSGSGGYLENGFGNASITISNASFSGNEVDGLEAYSNNDITVNNVNANFNTEIGATLANDTGIGNIFVSNSTFDSNGSTGEDMGMEVFSTGNITLRMVSASGNLAGNGALIAGFSSLLIENSTFNNNQSFLQEWGHGLQIEGEEAEIICSQFSGNSKYGIHAEEMGTLILDDVTFSGNGFGSYAGSAFIASGGCTPDEGDDTVGEEVEGGGEEAGGEEQEGDGGPSLPENPFLNLVVVNELPLHHVSVVGWEKIKLQCEAYSGTRLSLRNGDSIVLPCPIHDQGLLRRYESNHLPGKLNEKYRFLSAMDAEVLRNGQYIASLDATMMVDFVIPKDQNKAKLAILHWEGMRWVELDGSHVTEEGYLEATTSLTGIFVLVTK